MFEIFVRMNKAAKSAQLGLMYEQLESIKQRLENLEEKENNNVAGPTQDTSCAVCARAMSTRPGNHGRKRSRRRRRRSRSRSRRN